MIHRTPTEIAAELADVRAARAAFIRGERIVDVWRDGKRLKFSEMGLEDFNTAITSLESEYAGAVDGESGRRRRRPTRIAWRN